MQLITYENIMFLFQLISLQTLYAKLHKTTFEVMYNDINGF